MMTWQHNPFILMSLFMSPFYIFVDMLTDMDSKNGKYFHNQLKSG